MERDRKLVRLLPPGMIEPRERELTDPTPGRGDS